MSICNSIGYNRLKHFYIYKKKPSLAIRPLIIHFRTIAPQLLNDFWGFSPLDFRFNLLILRLVPRLFDLSFAITLAPAPLLLLLPPLWLISKNPKKSPLLFHLQATMLALSFLLSLASGFLLYTEF